MEREERRREGSGRYGGLGAIERKGLSEGFSHIYIYISCINESNGHK